MLADEMEAKPIKESSLNRSASGDYKPISKPDSSKKLSNLQDQRSKQTNLEENDRNNVISMPAQAVSDSLDHKKEEAEEKVFSDPVHDIIKLHPALVKIVDTPQFQRLRRIKKLAGAYRVFPGASHNLFEHSLGVCHITGNLINALKKSQDIKPVDELCVKIAGLCHDLGCGPLSSIFDMLCEQNKVTRWKPKHHEAASLAMFEHLLCENEDVNTLLGQCGVNAEKVKFIKALIDGESEDSADVLSRNDPSNFLRKIVVNEETGFDAVEIESLTRDCFCLGVPISFEFRRLVDLVRFESGHFCFRDKEINTIYDMFMSRLRVYRVAYYHKTVRIIEELYRDAMEAADNALKLTDTAKLVISGDQAACKKYTRLTDSVLDKIYDMMDESEQPQLSWQSDIERSKEILDRIENRRLYSYYGFFFAKEQTDKKACLNTDSIYQKFKENTNIFVDVIEFKFGTEKTKNPASETIYYYSKTNVENPVKMQENQVSRMVTSEFSEVVVRLYIKDRNTMIDDDEELSVSWKYL